MRFYTGQHRYYCGIDLHARTLYVCVLDCQGKIRLHKRLRCEREALLRALEPYRLDLVVGSECIFCWYWLADLCAREQIHFVLGHALYMKAIHGVKAKKRPHRLAQDGGLAAWWCVPGGLRLSSPDASHARCAPAPTLLRTQARRAPRPRPQHLSSVQPASALRSAPLQEEPRGTGPGVRRSHDPEDH